MRECPKCHGLLESDGSCACGYGIKRRSAVTEVSSGPILCSWSEFGRSCPARGIIHTGRWYCREHWERSRDLEPSGTGNYPVHSARSMEMRRWDDWYEPWLANRDRKQMLPNPLPTIMREPDADDDLVPAEADQA